MRVGQEGDPFPEFPDDTDLPAGEDEVSFRLKASNMIRDRGNILFNEVRASERLGEREGGGKERERAEGKWGGRVGDHFLPPPSICREVTSRK